MKLLRTAVVAALAASATSTLSAAVPEDDKLRAALIGIWCSSLDDGKSCYAWDEFKVDGTVVSCGTWPRSKRPWAATGAFRVSGRTVYLTVTSKSKSYALPVGDRFTTEVLAIDARSHTYVDNVSREQRVLYRVESSARSCPRLDEA
jgi:hypothetical protein